MAENAIRRQPQRKASASYKQSLATGNAQAAKQGTTPNAAATTAKCSAPAEETQSGRPRFSQESVWRVDFQQHTIQRSTGSAQQFSFDGIIQPNETTESLYAKQVQSLVADAVNGYNGTVMAYGPTGSGKTWSEYSLLHALTFLVERLAFSHDGQLEFSWHHSIGRSEYFPDHPERY